MEEMARRQPPELLVGKIEALLNSEIPAKVNAKTGEITPARPDPISVSAGLKLALGYLIGEPVKRMAIADATPRTEVDSQERIQRSPAAMRAMAELLMDSPEGRAAVAAAGALPKNRSVEIVEVEPEDEGAEG